MNPIQAIDELIAKTQQEEQQENNMLETLRIEAALKALELVKEMLEDAGQEVLHEAETAALEWLRLANDSGVFNPSKIRAIKAYRDIAGTSLFETKILVEALQIKHGLVAAVVGDKEADSATAVAAEQLVQDDMVQGTDEVQS